jgi:DNA-directed RNA polymerase specialized sigma24 family protein
MRLDPPKESEDACATTGLRPNRRSTCSSGHARATKEATNRLFARHVRPLQRWASGRLPKWARDVADTDDLVQETLLQTFKRIGQFESRGVGALHAYLRQAVLNRIREELRRKSRRPDGTSLSGLEAESHLSPLEPIV